MTLNQLGDFLNEFYGSKIKIVKVITNEKKIDFILYNYFSFTCGLDEHESFGAVIKLPNGMATTYFLGFECSLVENNEKYISKALRKIDDYCRLRLPDKFLEMYDKVYKD